MNYREKYESSKSECLKHVKTIIGELMKEELEVEGMEVVIPDDKDLEYKIKYENDEYEGSFSIKIGWVNKEIVEEEEEEEEV
ncbi:hypothetical protein [Geosporobacter ferrireducens]|uniref:Amphi-Trp domain-containing protein n=1 Tax=Geosporobacter ferrireducens TaxID=1424294 RepID=A0A1D8GKS9_9FIRM|nr:hypothetical protein [Geosporobacter ferrireducens]AOT71521.1 hypothetical protein Gferi_19490 [Geosporobacter ferrireducens]MTI57836.1 transcription initiation factor IIE [Geosporobacter ferrireducens]